MATPKELCYEKRGAVLVKNLKSRHFDAYYCANREEALKKALELIPEGATVGWGGAMSAQQIGLLDALNSGNYHALDREKCQTSEEREQIMRDCLFADVFLTGANGLSMDGEMVNIDGAGNRVASTLFGHKKVYFVIGRNKIAPTYDEALWRARNIAAPKNAQRLKRNTPCAVNADRCYNCKSPERICRGMVILMGPTMNMPTEVILVNEELGC